MSSKSCTRCGGTEPHVVFGRLSRSPDGLSKTCRGCKAAISKAWRDRNKSSLLPSERVRHRARRKVDSDARRAADEASGVAEARRLDSQARLRARRDRQNAARRAAYAANPEKFLARDRARSAARMEKQRERQRAAYPQLRKDPAIVVRTRMRNRMNIALSSGKAGRSWLQLVPYTVEELTQHLERQFLPGMSWGNRRKWHIDHVIPCAAFDQADPDQFTACWALTNLRPMWARDNISKGARRVTLL